ncbi:putative GntR family transcriptional regulator [Gordonia polyisoprenivorans NBRC 16320 = JCM 10675]|uniref:GntR family transcriptional regulator n=1 Tax=Gordonia polyisoprenivorans TaxID=84595 RepID=A0A846WIB8_9ACTN|nr:MULTISPECIES: GntR family transcriptional regulator [Gordonia]MDF3280747.1 GntR family transcriptional regulator [Gordonia sp. N1V]NKY00131.1 GntR family transcriptional regulator [Gordonia polyisoprenivorans]OPX12087.1 GntR family transcriptional regulator [Gordonia sp. i37]OZC33803.1 GntR family transcriptional regulator [Gordonia polyisoprenivorans]UZF57251.1 GntR family transcriptional regulator [Gordonia polyisoprenivorans]
MSVDNSDGALLTQAVLRRLRDEIFDGTMAPGTPLSVPGLATRLEVSRSPVREAVQQLVVEGLAEYTPRVGAKVAVLDEDMLRQVFEVREVLDGLAARQATARVTFADLEILWEHVRRQEEMLDSPADHRRDAELDLDFHTAVRTLSGNKPLCDALLKLDTQSHLYRSDMWALEVNRRLAVTEHRRIVAALEAGDADGAQRAACAHAAGVLVRLLRS